jgi:putative acetyltransferase
VLIRPERDSDFDAIHDVVTQAFGRSDEAELVTKLRASDAYVPELALVYEDAGTVVGHIMLSYAELIGALVPRILSLAPLSVRPNRQRSGIGIALTEAALARAEERGEPAVIVLGHAAYYPRFGFEPARPLGIESPIDELPDNVWMVKRLGAYDPTVRGRVVYPAPFETTT